MQFIQGNNRHQRYFSILKDQVNTENSVRLIDPFTDKLDVEEIEIAKDVT